MRRTKNRRPFPWGWMLLLVVLLLSGLILRGSGLLYTLGLLEVDLPDNLDQAASDERITERYETDGGQTRALHQEFLRILTNQPKEGFFKVRITDAGLDFPIAGVKIHLYSQEGEVLKELITDEEGEVTTDLLPYRQAYRLAITDMPAPYLPSDESVFLAMQAPEIDIHLTGRLPGHIKAYQGDGQGGVKIGAVSMPVPQIYQKPELPNGCEITALASVLQAEGYEAPKELLSDEYLAKSPFVRRGGQLYGGDPEEVFAGDPRDGGSFYVFTKPVVAAARDYIADVGGSHQVIDLTGAPEEEILSWLEKGTPVVIWTTLDLSPVNVNYSWLLHDSDTRYEAIVNLHAMTIHGFDEETVEAMDPLAGPMRYDRDLFFASYEDMGRRALVVEEVAGE